jgi:hypothetical protein
LEFDAVSSRRSTIAAWVRRCGSSARRDLRAARERLDDRTAVALTVRLVTAIGSG